MKTVTVCIVKLAVACKLDAATALRPCLTRCKQCSRVSATAMPLLHIDALKISDRRRRHSLNIIPTKTALRKPYRLRIAILDIADRVIGTDDLCKLRPQFIRRMLSQMCDAISARTAMSAAVAFLFIMPLLGTGFLFLYSIIAPMQVLCNRNIEIIG